MNPQRAWHLTTRLLTACVLATLTACSVYDDKALDETKKPPTNGKDDAGADSATPMGQDGGGDAGDSSVDAAISCVPTGDELCNGLDDDCDGTTDEEKAATADCADQRPHALNISCVAETCLSDECEPGYRDANGRPQDGCETKCTDGLCDDAGTDDGGTL